MSASPRSRAAAPPSPQLQPSGPPQAAPGGDGANSLYRQVLFARLWLPLTIVGVVLIHQLLVVPLLPAPSQFWAQLLFYAILGPAATFVTLNWIADETRLKERAQEELGALYRELQESHELLGRIQDVTASFAASPDLETTLAAASDGLLSVTDADAVALIVGPRDLGVTRGVALDADLERDALERDLRARTGGGGQLEVQLAELRPAPGSPAGGPDYALTMPLLWGGKAEGSVSAYYRERPEERVVESFSIIGAQFSAAAEATRFRTRDLLTLVEVDRSIRAEGNLDHLLQTVLTQMLAFVSAPVGGMFLADDEGTLVLRVASGIAAADVPVTWRVGEGYIGQVAESREPRILTRLRSEPVAGVGPLLNGAGSAVAVPLLVEGGLLGVLVLAHPDEEHFDRSVLPFLGLAAGQVSLAVANASAYLQSEELAIAEERTRIAREIHDGVAQMLAFTALKLDLVGRLLERDREQAVAELAAAKDTVRESIKEIRRSIFALRPVDLERHGFSETVRRYVLDFGQQNDIRVAVEAGDLPTLSVKSEAVLFRIFQEAMHNVAKHAKAGSVTVSLGTAADGMAFVTVEDDGGGFELADVGDRVSSAGGLGLRQMRERVQARDGRLEISTSPGQGTKLYAAVPG